MSLSSFYQRSRSKYDLDTPIAPRLVFYTLPRFGQHLFVCVTDGTHITFLLCCDGFTTRVRITFVGFHLNQTQTADSSEAGVGLPPSVNTDHTPVEASTVGDDPCTPSQLLPRNCIVVRLVSSGFWSA